MDEGDCFVRWTIPPGNTRETCAQEPVAYLTNARLSLGGVSGDAALPPLWKEDSGDVLASIDEPGAELDRDTVHRACAFF